MNPAKLEIKTTQIYQKGPEPFILKNNEEIIPAKITTDDCFYYVEIQSKESERIKIIFAYVCN